jgi:hypothetical protein
MSFEDRLINANDELIQENTPLIINTEEPYRRIKTTTFIIIHILFVVN